MSKGKIILITIVFLLLIVFITFIYSCCYVASKCDEEMDKYEKKSSKVK